MAILSINGTDMPSPSAMEVRYEPVGKTETNAAGNTVMDRLGMKRLLKITWNHLSAEDAAILLTAAQSENWNELEFYDPAEGRQQGVFRAERTSAPVHRVVNDVPEYRGVQIEFRER